MTMTRRLLIAWIVVAVTPAAFASSNVCVTARVDAPFWLPDGILRPASSIHCLRRPITRDALRAALLDADAMGRSLT